MYKYLIFLLLIVQYNICGQTESYKIGILKYSGGGDWYSNPTALKNLISFCNEEMKTDIDPKYDEIDIAKLNLNH